jgi:lipoic acid synthetase
MILGDVCTRGCRYCAVSKGKPEQLDLEEPLRVANAVTTMNLSHVVITSVNRDELEDGGAEIFAETIRQIRSKQPDCSVEVLVPDFQGSEEAVRTVLDEEPEIFGHNIETVPRLYRRARGGGIYEVSLGVLERARRLEPHLTTKTGLMLGLGEEPGEIRTVMKDLVSRKVNILTLGQYLRPSQWHLPVARYYEPEEFHYWKQVGKEIGFDYVESAPLVRSSYMADKQFAAVSKQSPGPSLVQIG